jgi:signal transduction histidine kinase
VEAVVETLATLHGQGENLAEIAHDARNMVTALGLYCDLLEEPGVLAVPYLHYAGELRLVAAASRRLVEKLVSLDTQAAPGAASSRTSPRGPGPFGPGTEAAAAGSDVALDRSRRWESVPAEPISSLAAELRANRNLLAALAGPSIGVILNAVGGDGPVGLTGEDLIRVLVNVVKNAAEAMPEGGLITLGLKELETRADGVPWLALTIEDNGPGIPPEALGTIFESGYSTHSSPRNGSWPATHRGLGLSISRSIIEAAGGRIEAKNRSAGGACFTIELPVRML